MEIRHNTIYANKNPQACETTLPILQELSKWKDRHFHLGIGYGDGSDSKEAACNAGDPGSIPEGRSPEVGNGNLL